MWKRLLTAALLTVSIPNVTPAQDVPTPPPLGSLDDQVRPIQDASTTNAYNACSLPSCFWLRADYLLWWTKGSQSPDLVTTGIPGGSTMPGVLGYPGTRVLFGGSEFENGPRSGGRFSGGLWLDESRTLALEASYFFLGDQSTRFDAGSSGALGSSMIARPFYDVISGVENAQLVAFPGLASGDIHIESFSRLQGGEINLSCFPIYVCQPVCAPPPCETGAPVAATPPPGFGYGRSYSVNMLAGFRYLQLEEGIRISEMTRVNPALPAGNLIAGGSVISSTDRFETQNHFYGAQVGTQGRLCWGRVSLDGQAKIALGTTHQVIDIYGQTQINTPNRAPLTAPTGFLATQSNSGHFTKDRFTVVPEVGLNLGYQVTQHMRASVGYTFLYTSSVVRPGDQIDVGLSGTQILTDNRFNPQAPPARPAPKLQDTDYWAQGINFGLEFRY